MIIPRYPGLTSALGLLFVEPLDDFSGAFLRRGDEVDLADLGQRLEEIGEQVTENLLRQGVDGDEIVLENGVDLRYIGQLHAITVPLLAVTDEALCEAIAEFHAEHRRQYRYSHPESPVEITVLRVNARGKRSLRDVALGQNGSAEIKDYRRDVYFDGWVDTHVVDRGSLGAGASLTGPCVVEGLDTTIVVPPGFNAEVDRGGNITIDLEGGR